MHVWRTVTGRWFAAAMAERGIGTTTQPIKRLRERNAEIESKEKFPCFWEDEESSPQAHLISPFPWPSIYLLSLNQRNKVLSTSSMSIPTGFTEITPVDKSSTKADFSTNRTKRITVDWRCHQFTPSIPQNNKSSESACLINRPNNHVRLNNGTNKNVRKTYHYSPLRFADFSDVYLWSIIEWCPYTLVILFRGIFTWFAH